MAETEEREGLLAKLREMLGAATAERCGYAQASTQNLRETVAACEEQLEWYRSLGIVEETA